MAFPFTEAPTYRLLETDPGGREEREEVRLSLL